MVNTWCNVAMKESDHGQVEDPPPRLASGAPAFAIPVGATDGHYCSWMHRRGFLVAVRSS